MDNSDVGDAAAQNPHLQPLGAMHEQGLKKAATHHQKMVLVDYALPDKTKGYVLGSNTLPRYWDTNDHPIEHNNRRMDYIDTVATDTSFDGEVSYTRTPATVKLGPWQDISAAVFGEVLFDLHANFASAWQRAGGSALEPARDAVTPQMRLKGPVSFTPMQVVRTQPQEGDHSISDVYFQNVQNARQYIYLENQYFRLPELTQELDKTAGKLASWGREDNLYVFVVTNKTPDQYGRLNTYKMLAALGKAEQMPVMNKDTQANPKKAIAALPSTNRDVAGLKSVICTLTACEGSTAKDLRYAPIYVHSKLMAIDDHFFTLGSANLNARSMASDSELNVAVPHDTLTKELRTKLWGMHRGQSLEGDFAKEFKEWGEIAKDNLDHFQTKDKPLIGRLTRFNDTGAVVNTAYD
jgi:phosphatidylserine/phosphatidylglycerophosphate/cardiolipin synthase-like enzyme